VESRRAEDDGSNTLRYGPLNPKVPSDEIPASLENTMDQKPNNSIIAFPAGPIGELSHQLLREGSAKLVLQLTSPEPVEPAKRF